MVLHKKGIYEYSKLPNIRLYTKHVFLIHFPGYILFLGTLGTFFRNKLKWAYTLERLTYFKYLGTLFVSGCKHLLMQEIL